MSIITPQDFVGIQEGTPKAHQHHRGVFRPHHASSRSTSSLISLGRQELEDMIRQQGGCQLSCQFCDTVYDFSKEELEQLLASLQEKK